MASSINLQHYYNDANSACLPCDVRVRGGDHKDNENSRLREQNKIMKESEELLASNLKKLSLQERTEAFEDVHCVGEELKETPQKTKQALEDFAAAVVALLREDSYKYVVYEMAVLQNRAYVEDDSFRLKFLRANFYNVDKSVRQMMRFLKHKETYFGIDKVAKEITLDDLNEKDMEVLNSGLWHFQEGRDQSGRVILHGFSNMRWKTENLIRAGYIVFFNILASEPTVQTKGVVRIVHNVARSGQQIAMPRIDTLMTANNAYTQSFPIRLSAMHFCLHQKKSAKGEGSDFFRSILLPVLKAMPLYETARCRIHDGHSVELQYQLRTHGIPLDSFPVDMDGKVREDIFFAWLHKYQQAERRNGRLLSSKGSDGKSTSVAAVSNEMHHSTSGVPQLGVPLVAAPPILPSENDVLIGRGKCYQTWPGNVMFREFLEEQREDYDQLPQFDRKRRTVELTESLLSKGVRFYGADKLTGEWVEVTFESARLKVSHTFRTLRKGKPKVG